MPSKRAHISRAVKPERRSSSLRAPWIILGILVVAVVVLGAVFLLNKEPDQTTAALPAAVTVNDAYILYKKNAVFVDIRSTNEWKSYHITNSKSIPLDTLSSGSNSLPRHTDIVVVDKDGGLSAQGREILLKAGFDRVTALVGGIQEWILSGHPFEGNFPY